MRYLRVSFFVLSSLLVLNCDLFNNDQSDNNAASQDTVIALNEAEIGFWGAQYEYFNAQRNDSGDCKSTECFVAQVNYTEAYNRYNYVLENGTYDYSYSQKNIHEIVSYNDSIVNLKSEYYQCTNGELDTVPLVEDYSLSYRLVYGEFHLFSPYSDCGFDRYIGESNTLIGLWKEFERGVVDSLNPSCYRGATHISYGISAVKRSTFAKFTDNSLTTTYMQEFNCWVDDIYRPNDRRPPSFIKNNCNSWTISPFGIDFTTTIDLSDTAITEIKEYVYKGDKCSSRRIYRDLRPNVSTCYNFEDTCKNEFLKEYCYNNRNQRQGNEGNVGTEFSTLVEICRDVEYMTYIGQADDITIH
ncbi:MAG: hypothetical protein OCD01_09985 [Fibrobacterales bacterium]